MWQNRETRIGEEGLGSRRPCEQRDYDTENKRPVAVCSIDAEDLHAWMVSQGWAIAYRKFSTDYVDEEDDARAKKNGAWRGEFVPPMKWKHGARLPSETKVQP